jgi:hypothetical protein
MHFLSSTASVIALGTIVQGAYLKNTNARYIDARQVQSSYDYVVVGGGHSGTVVAARLSENPEGITLGLTQVPLLTILKSVFF